VGPAESAGAAKKTGRISGRGSGQESGRRTTRKTGPTGSVTPESVKPGSVNGKPGAAEPEPEPSESERLLFGGPLRYDMGWSQHSDAFMELNFRAMVTRLPALLASSFRLAWQADRQAARIVLARRWAGVSPRR
jgi:ATP-binding cassette subfamily B protein